MQDDTHAATRTMIDKGIADPGRIAIMGGSYGGYAAYMGLIRAPELFRCAASYGGVADLDLHLDLDQRGGDYLRSVNEVSIGRESADRVKLARTSPAKQASRIKAPVLVAHSKDDQRVKIDQSEAMIAALEKAGVPHTPVVLDHGMHYLNVERYRIRFFEELEKFLADCTAPLPAEDGAQAAAPAGD